MTFKVKNIKNVIAGSALVLTSLGGPSVFADGFTPITVGTDQRPKFELSLIDLTNNKLDFGFTQVGMPGDATDIGAWIVNDDEVEDYTELDESALTLAYGNDSGADFEKYYKYSKNVTKHYVVPAEVNLSEASTGKMFYMTTLDDGTIWAFLVDYSDCLSGWEYGKACAADTFEIGDGRVVTEINYVLVDVEVDDSSDDENGGNSDNGGENGGNGESTDENNSGENGDGNNENEENNGGDGGDSSGENEDNNEDGGGSENSNDENKNVVATVTTSDKSSNSGNSEVAVSTATTSTNNSSTQVSTSENISENNNSETNEEEESETETEVEKKTEETTLEVPELGKDTKMENILKNLAWLVFFLAGAMTGTISTWFLLSDHKKMTENRK